MPTEQSYCGLNISFLYDDGEPEEVFELCLKDNLVPNIEKFEQRNGWGDFHNKLQIVKDMIEFNEYVKRTHYAERSFEENLYIILSQIICPENIVITSEDGKHKCSVKEVGCPGMLAYKLDIDGKTSIIYDFTLHIRGNPTMFSLREINLFFMIVIGKYFE